jgi:hypothetical protein
MRLQVLAAMGEYDAVLEAVEALRPEMEALPLEREAEEAVLPWNVREVLLNAGAYAATGSEGWEEALELNAEIVASKEARGASALEVARGRFGDYGPLLGLGRTDEARDLLLDCRAVFEAERDILYLGKVCGGLADLEDETGGREAAVRFEEVALGYKYQAGEPQACAISHHNLANYLARQGADPADVLAHRLADAVICYQTQSGGFGTSLRNLARSDLPPAPPPFTDVVERVQVVEGVRFGALFERLPRTVADGDAALRAIWELVAEERQRRDGEVERREKVMAGLPVGVREAFELEGEAFGAALGDALAELPEEEAQAIVQQLEEAGLIRASRGPDMAEVLEDFEPLLQRIAAAVAEEGLRGESEAELAELEERGWMLREPAQRIWAGERDAEALTEEIDGDSAQLVRRVLELVEG